MHDAGRGLQGAGGVGLGARGAMHDAGRGLQGAGTAVLGARCAMHDAGRRLQGAGTAVLGARGAMHDAGRRLQGAGTGVLGAWGAMHDAGRRLQGAGTAVLGVRGAMHDAGRRLQGAGTAVLGARGAMHDAGWGLHDAARRHLVRGARCTMRGCCKVRARGDLVRGWGGKVRTASRERGDLHPKRLGGGAPRPAHTAAHGSKATLAMRERVRARGNTGSPSRTSKSTRLPSAEKRGRR